MGFGRLGAGGFGSLGLLGGKAKPRITLSASSIPEGSANDTVVGTASLIGHSTGTPSWSLTDATGTFQINSSTGVITVLDNTDLVYATHPSIPITVSVSGTTPAFPDLVTAITVTEVAQSFLLLADNASFLLLTNGTDRLVLAGPGF